MTLKPWVLLLALLLLLEGCIPAAYAASRSGQDDPDTAVIPGGGRLPSTTPYAQNEDESLKHADVKVESLSILASESFPPQYRLEVMGSLPTPCHQLRTIVDVPALKSEIHVQIFSVYDPYAVCKQVLRPFNVSIPLGSYVRGSIPVFVNGKVVGEITP